MPQYSNQVRIYIHIFNDSHKHAFLSSFSYFHAYFRPRAQNKRTKDRLSWSRMYVDIRYPFLTENLNTYLEDFIPEPMITMRVFF